MEFDASFDALRTLTTARYSFLISPWHLNTMESTIISLCQCTCHEDVLSTTRHAELASVRQRDKNKRTICYNTGISLIVIPFWWDKKIESVVQTIRMTRPDIMLSYKFDDASYSIPTEMPSHIIPQGTWWFSLLGSLTLCQCFTDQKKFRGLLIVTLFWRQHKQAQTQNCNYKIINLAIEHFACCATTYSTIVKNTISLSCIFCRYRMITAALEELFEAAKKERQSKIDTLEHKKKEMYVIVQGSLASHSARHKRRDQLSVKGEFRRQEGEHIAQFRSDRLRQRLQAIIAEERIAKERNQQVPYGCRYECNFVDFE